MLTRIEDDGNDNGDDDDNDYYDHYDDHGDADGDAHGDYDHSHSIGDQVIAAEGEQKASKSLRAARFLP